MWRYAGHLLGIHEDLLPRTLQDQQEFMWSSTLHQGSPDSIDGPGLQQFIHAFALDAHHGTRGMIPTSYIFDFLSQLTCYLNGAEHMGDAVVDKGVYHWSIMLVRLMGFTVGTVLPRFVPFGEALLFRFHESRVKKELRRRGVPTGHGAGSGADIGTSTTRSRL